MMYFLKYFIQINSNLENIKEGEKTLNIYQKSQETAQEELDNSKTSLDELYNMLENKNSNI